MKRRIDILVNSAGRVLVLLLCAGSKKTQTGDIARAARYRKDYLNRYASER